jgi:membrane-bound ClpP family serine protease
MIDWVTVLVLILAGIVFVIVEIIFVPGTTILGIIGLAMMIFGVVLSYNKFGSNTGTIVLIGTALVGAAITVVSFKSGVWRKFALKTAMRGKVNEDVKINLFVKDVGETVSALRPIGKAEFGDRTFEVRTIGNYVEAGTKVEITKIDNNKIFVQPIN